MIFTNNIPLMRTPQIYTNRRSKTTFRVLNFRGLCQIFLVRMKGFQSNWNPFLFGWICRFRSSNMVKYKTQKSRLENTKKKSYICIAWHESMKAYAVGGCSSSLNDLWWRISPISHANIHVVSEWRPPHHFFCFLFLCLKFVPILFLVFRNSGLNRWFLGCFICGLNSFVNVLIIILRNCICS